MRIFAYCTEVAREAVGKATGILPVTSPPISAATFDLAWLEWQDLIYFRLHGWPGRVGWFGEGVDGGEVLALTPVQLGMAHLDGAICVVANCYGADDDPMVAALYRAGARAVIGGHGPNVAAARRVVGADLLAKWIILGLRLGFGVEGALRGARARLRLTSWRDSDKDAAEFEVIARK